MAADKQKVQQRHEFVRQKFNELYGLRIEGMRPNFSDVITKVAEVTFYSRRTVMDILNS